MSKFLKAFNKFANNIPLFASRMGEQKKEEGVIFYSAKGAEEFVQEGIGLELETWYDPVVSPELKSFFINNEIVGDIASGKANRFNSDKLPLRLDATNIAIEAPTIFRRIIIPNLSPLVFKEPVMDGTINNGTGGPEFQLSPVDLSALPVTKIELYRILYYLKQANFKFDLSDTSIHLHASYSMLGGTKDAVELTLSNLLWFLWEAREFMPIFCGRQGAGITLTELRSHLGDPLNIYNEHELFSRFMATKMKALELFQDTESWVEEAFPGRLKKTKGVFNFILNGEHGTLENRWFQSSDNVDTIMAYYEFYFALIEFCKQNRVLSAKEKVLENFCLFVDTPEYPHLVEKLKSIPMTERFIKGEYLYLETSVFEKEILEWDYSFIPENLKYVASEVAKEPFSSMGSEEAIEPVVKKKYAVNSSYSGKPIEEGNEIAIAFQKEGESFRIAFIDKSEVEDVNTFLLMRQCYEEETSIDSYNLSNTNIVKFRCDVDEELYYPSFGTMLIHDDIILHEDNKETYIEDNEIDYDDFESEARDLNDFIKGQIALKQESPYYSEQLSFIRYLNEVSDFYVISLTRHSDENRKAYEKALNSFEKIKEEIEKTNKANADLVVEIPEIPAF